MRHTRPEDLFRAEKERARSSSASQHARLLAEAKAAFDKLMAEGQAARKSGRPRKHPLPPLKTSSSRTPARPPAIVAAKPTPAMNNAAAPAPVALVPTAPAAKPTKAAPPPPQSSVPSVLRAKATARRAKPAAAKRAKKPTRSAKSRPSSKSKKR